jgi:hypothetical protein
MDGVSRPARGVSRLRGAQRLPAGGEWKTNEGTSIFDGAD